MLNTQLEALAQSQRDRLAFIDLRLNYFGEINRQDLLSRFNIQMAAATRDFAIYKKLAPQNIVYNINDRLYVRGAQFYPVFEFPLEQVLDWLSKGLGDKQPARFKPLIQIGYPDQLAKPDKDILAITSQAIFRKGIIGIKYFSLKDGETSRKVAPFALVNNGKKWLIRAFDRKENQFRDFVLSRITHAEFVSDEVEEHESPASDQQWNRFVDLELVPHPVNTTCPKSVEIDYSMKQGVLKINERAALAGYLLNLWQVDCSKKHSLKGAEYQLWLRNQEAVYGINNLSLAPGYK